MFQIKQIDGDHGYKWVVVNGFGTAIRSFMTRDAAEAETKAMNARDFVPRKAGDKVAPAELVAGDVITVGPDQMAPFSAALVTRVEDGQVHLDRSYMTASDFTQGTPERVIPYIGVEHYSIQVSDTRLVTWWHRAGGTK